MATQGITRLTAVVAIAIVAAACGSSSGSTSGSSTSSKGTTTTSAACAGAEWSDVTSAWKTLAPGPYAEGRQQVADDLAALRRGQDTSEVGQVSVAEVRTGEPLVVALSETGVPDVQVQRVDTEITLDGGDQGWSVTAARQRSICAGASG
jgi:hypothetical protein